MTQDAVAGGLNLVTSYGYDEVGNRISQTDANQHTTTYSYDNLGRRTSRKLPPGQAESYAYDAAGKLKTKVDFNGKTTTYAYDTNNRLLSKTPDPSFSAQPVSFTDYNNGLRKTMVDPSGTTSYGNQLFMDDANLPGLLRLPYLGCCAQNDPCISEHGLAC